jgi:hypothetical protein
MVIYNVAMSMIAVGEDTNLGLNKPIPAVVCVFINNKADLSFTSIGGKNPKCINFYLLKCYV